ncbi:MAG: GNAT family N-acetyltransferase [Octadecabacter sp.]
MFEVVEDNVQQLIVLDRLVNLADQYKDEIGFWAKASIQSAIERNRLLAAFHQGTDTIVGFMIFSGIFPTSKIQAVVVHRDWQRQGVAQLLIDAAIERLEREGFMTVSARPAEDLVAAQTFYEKNNFQVARVVEGGKARKRRIIVRERALAVPSLFDALDRSRKAPTLTPMPAQDRLWVLDINVLFDLIKHGRDRYQQAYRMFGAALAGRINVVVTSEFQRELARNKPKVRADPAYELASALPTMHLSNDAALKDLAKQVHDLVFVQKGSRQAGSVQALSDSRHVAESILGKAGAFITSDGPMLDTRTEIRSTFGLDIAALDEFDDALSSYTLATSFAQTSAEGFDISGGQFDEVLPFAIGCGAEALLIKFQRANRNIANSVVVARNQSGETHGVLILRKSQVLGEQTEILLLCDQKKSMASHVVDALLTKAIDDIAQAGPQLVQISTAQGQTIASKLALEAGFRPSEGKHTYQKLILGRPVTPKCFDVVQNKLRLLLGESGVHQWMPSNFEDIDQLHQQPTDEFDDLEQFSSPALFASNHRNIIIQPIAKSFADQLLGTTGQLSFLEQFGGATKSEKIYVCSGRKRNSYHIGQIVLFYESSRTGGRGAVVAAASVRSVLLMDKEKVTQRNLSKTVLDSVSDMSSTDEVTMVGFSNVLRLPNPIRLPRLKALGAHTGQNFVSATPIATHVGQAILDEGWDHDS